MGCLICAVWTCRFPTLVLSFSQRRDCIDRTLYLRSVSVLPKRCPTRTKVTPSLLPATREKGTTPAKVAAISTRPLRTPLIIFLLCAKVTQGNGSCNIGELRKSSTPIYCMCEQIVEVKKNLCCAAILGRTAFLLQVHIPNRSAPPIIHGNVAPASHIAPRVDIDHCSIAGSGVLSITSTGEMGTNVG